MAACTITASGQPPATAAPIAGLLAGDQPAVGPLLAVVIGLRARGLRGVNVLRRSRDRAPPAFS